MASPDLRTFDAAEFLRELTAGLSASISSRERGIPITVDADPVAITLDIDSPIGLLLTELVTNSAKHAYRDTAGMIRVQFRLLPERAALIVDEAEGDAPGVAQDFTANRLRHGVQIVNGRGQQVGGEKRGEYARRVKEGG